MFTNCGPKIFGPRRMIMLATLNVEITQEENNAHGAQQSNAILHSMKRGW
jgi:hypothetical protein